jgi:hypothetical protein
VNAPGDRPQHTGGYQQQTDDEARLDRFNARPGTERV